MIPDNTDEQAPKCNTVTAELHAQSIKIMAKSLVRELRTRGYGARHIVALSTELLGIAAEEMTEGRETAD